MLNPFGLLLASLGAAALFASAAQAETIELDGLKSEAPKAWKQKPANNKLRLHQFTVPKAEGDPEDAELVVFFFGPGGGGGNADNIKRWESMFEAPEGKKASDVNKLEKFKVGEVDITYLDQQGTFLSKFPPFAPNAKVVRKDNYRRLAVIFESKNGPYFITLTGPAKTMSSAKGGFDSWIKNFK